MYGYREIEDIENFRTLVEQENIIEHCAFQNIDFSLETVECCFKDCLFFGCTVPDSMQHMLSQECYQYPKIDKPYNIFPSHLYSAAELYAGYDPHNPSTYNNCYDCRIYNHYIAEGKRARDISETFARAMHDHSISDALHDLLSHYNDRQVVSVMGGHALLRTDTVYRKVVLIAKHLTSAGCIIVTGGGPGAMEAAHLGAWLAGYPDEVVDEALAMLATAPCYKDEGWLSTAFALMERYPSSSGYSSVGVPTWFYGHEPTTPFATHIAKYFDNSIREDGILEIAKHADVENDAGPQRSLPLFRLRYPCNQPRAHERHDRARRHQQRILGVPVHVEEIAHRQQPDPLRLMRQDEIDQRDDREKEQKLQ